MRILVMFTGGTIGCGLPDEEGVLSVQNAAQEEYYLLEQFRRHSTSSFRTVVEFDIMEPLQTLSENMTPEKWNVLLRALQQIDISDYDGIIITHGTDTLAWSAALFDQLLAGVKIPVIFVSSNYNLFDERANGHPNFENAVDFIGNARLPGVYVIFRDKAGRNKVYPGAEIKQSQAFIDEYENAFGEDFGYMEKGTFLEADRKRMPRLIQEYPLLHQIRELKGEILLLRPYVGLRYDRINLIDKDGQKVDAVLHETYHSFTACTEGGEDSPYSILYLQKRCKEEGIPLYAAPFDDRVAIGEGERYASTDRMLQEGILPLAGMSLESAYARILMDLSLKTR